MIGILQGVGAVVGISGTLMFPLLRKKIGLEHTGTIGGVLQLCALSLCVVSVFAPGSPFDAAFLKNSHGDPLPTCQDVTLPNSGSAMDGASVYKSLSSVDSFSYSYSLHGLNGPLRSFGVISEESDVFNSTIMPADCLPAGRQM